jgi:hypothetical protein
VETRTPLATPRARGRPGVVLQPPRVALCARVARLARPRTLEILAAAAMALVAIVRWARETLLSLPEHARTRSF